MPSASHARRNVDIAEHIPIRFNLRLPLFHKKARFMIRTVTGDIANITGPILCHEHWQIDLCCQKGPDVVLNEGDREDVINDLGQAMKLGLKAVVDLSVLGSGRDAVGLKQISERAGLP
jgi:predicted metal-dependent phosphotriesterase family hydrolase